VTVRNDHTRPDLPSAPPACYATFALALLCLAPLLFAFSVSVSLLKDVSDFLEKLRMLVEQPTCYRQVCPLHVIKQTEQLDRRGWALYRKSLDELLDLTLERRRPFPAAR
jgi:hypothetical protein